MPADATVPTTIDDLLALEAIRQVKYRYLRFLDQKQWDRMAEVLRPDVTASYGGGAYPCDGLDAVLAFLQKGMGREDFLSSHRCHHPEIALTSPTTAEGIWAFDDTVIIGEWDLIVHGAGFYEDRYERDDDGRWWIAHTGYRRSFEQLVPRASVAGLKLTASWWGTGGRSQLPA